VLSTESVTDQLFRTAVLLSPYSAAEHTTILEFDASKLDHAAQRCHRHVEAYVAQRNEEGDELTIFSEALEEVAELTGRLEDQLEEILEVWCSFCDLARERDRGIVISTASMVALEPPYVTHVRCFADDIGLPLGDTVGRLSRLHGLFCPGHPHPDVPQLILGTLPSLGYFL